MIVRTAGVVFGDMAIGEKDFLAADFAIGVAKSDGAGAKRFHFGANQNQPRFKTVENVIIVGSGAVLGNDLEAGIGRIFFAHQIP